MYPLLEIAARLACSVHLPEPCKARANGQSGVMPEGAALVFGFGRRPWSDEAHLTEQDINELRGLVDIRISQEVSDAGDPGIVGYFELWSVDVVFGHELMLHVHGADDHGSELEAVEGSAVQALAFVSEQDGSGGIEFDAQGNYEEYRGKQEKKDRRKKQVGDSFSASSVGEQWPGAVIAF